MRLFGYKGYLLFYANKQWSDNLVPHAQSNDV